MTQKESVAAVLGAREQEVELLRAQVRNSTAVLPIFTHSRALHCKSQGPKVRTRRRALPGGR